MKFHIKPEQGIVSGCNHNAESNKENFISHVNVNNFKRCSLCLKHFNAISDTLYTSLKSASFTSLPSPALNFTQHAKESMTTPLISINIFDPDNSNICMCNNFAIENRKNAPNESLITVAEEDDDDSTCRICQNMIEKSAEDIRTVVFEKTEKTMFGDVIVNRIDSQYHLSSTYANNPSDIKKLQDPYTPESVESHSPLPEMEEKYYSVTVDVAEEIIEEIEDIVATHKHESNLSDDTHPYQSNHIVTPSQLTTRLEILRRESQFMIGEGGKSGNGGDGENDASTDDYKSSQKSKKCFRCFCSIS